MPASRPGAVATIRELLQSGLQRLAKLETARIDCEVLLCSVLNQQRHFLYGYPDTAVDAQTVADFNSLIAKRAAGYPIAYLTGRKEFWSVSLEVNRDTLIPRHETELLVELALETIPKTGSYNVLDLGTGSGAIAIAIASERPLCSVTAIDVSREALDVARRNADRFGLRNTRFVQSDWFASMTAQHYDLIVSNPPYVESGYSGFVTDEIRHEPRIALDGGDHGLDAYRRIIPAAAAFLTSGGYIMVEHGHRQGEPVRQLLQLNHYLKITTRQDTAGHERITFAELP